MTNDTVVASQAIKPSDIYEEGAVVFPVLHGPMGEDGSIQGFLETLRLPYVGTNVLSSSVAMDKIMTKHILEVAGVPQVAYTAVSYTHLPLVLHRSQKLFVTSNLSLVVKPNVNTQRFLAVNCLML